MGLMRPLLAQEDILKEFARERHSASYCLYPSTLRMINVTRDADVDEMASSVEKFLIFELDSMSIVEQAFTPMLTDYRDEGFEEYMYILGDGHYTVILGKEKRVNEMIGIVGLQGQMFAFFLAGNVAWQKIPSFIRTLSENDIFSLLDKNAEK